MYLTGMIQRHRLHNVAMRWLRDDARPTDARQVTEIFAYEGLVTIPLAQRFMREVFSDTFGEPLSSRRIEYKHELRELALEAIGNPTPRQYEMMEAYHANPEAFFRRMPVAGAMVFGPDAQLIGTSRIKRPRRVAEKASRRMSEHLVAVIRERAEELARIRAARQGLALHQLGSVPDHEQREFEQAEASVAESFRNKAIRIPAESLHIDDLIGYKIIGNDRELERAEVSIARHPLATVVEREVHEGNYNAINIHVDLALPTPEKVAEAHRDFDWSILGARGIKPERLRDGLLDYVETGARTFRIELVLTSFPEYLESELGRSIHEFRILEQRNNREYRGRMAKNAELIIEFLIAVAYAPTIDLDGIPVKMWGRYLPETLSHAVRQLYGRSQAGLIYSTDLLL